MRSIIGIHSPCFKHCWSCKSSFLSYGHCKRSIFGLIRLRFLKLMSDEWYNSLASFIGLKIGHGKNCFQFHMWSASLLHGDSNLSFSNIDIAEFWNEVEGLYQVIGSSADTCPYIWLLDNPAWSEELLIPGFVVSWSEIIIFIFKTSTYIFSVN